MECDQSSSAAFTLIALAILRERKEGRKEKKKERKKKNETKIFKKIYFLGSTHSTIEQRSCDKIKTSKTLKRS